MRDSSISISKAIAIILMVLAHTQFSDYGNAFINMFHMPLFFFFSGYCLKECYLSDFKTFAVKRLKGLWIPFVKWSLLFLVCHNLFYYLNLYNDVYGFLGSVSHLYTIRETLTKAVHIILFMTDSEQLLGGYWFLHTLFFASFMAYFTIRILKSKYVAFGVAGLLLISMVILYFGEVYPSVGKEFVAAALFVIGHQYKTSGLTLERYTAWAVVLGMTLVTMGTSYWQCYMLTPEWYQTVPYVVSALAGTMAVFAISKWIDRNESFPRKLLVYIGDHTLEILTWHLLCFNLVDLLIIWIYALPIEHLAEFPTILEHARSGWWVLYLIVGCAVPMIGVYCRERKSDN